LDAESVVSLGPEEEDEMVEYGPRDVTTGTDSRESNPEVEDESTYILIHGHSFSFGVGDLRLWLLRVGTEAVLASIVGIYHLLQLDYRVDYLFEVRGARNAEVLRLAGDQNA
jgi:hypothetical protein